MSHVSERVEQIEKGYAVENQRLIIFKENFTQTEWAEWGRALAARHESSSWAIGDWLLAGGRRDWNTNNQWTGSAFQEAAKITGYEIARLRVYAKTCELFPPDTRCPTLHFTLHWMATSLPPDMRMEGLKRVELGDGDGKPWTVTQFREHINEQMALPEMADVIEARKKAGTVVSKGPQTIVCPNCQYVIPVEVKSRKIVIREKKTPAK